MAEVPANAALLMDRGIPVGNSDDGSGRRGIHVLNKIGALTKPYNGGTVAFPDAVTEVWSFTLDSVLTQTMTIVYTDSTKSCIQSFAVV